MNDMHRTPEWARLKSAGFFQIEDRPGEIILTRVSPQKRTLNILTMVAVGFPVAAFLLGLVGGFWGACGAGFSAALFGAILFFVGVLPAKRRLEQFADGVIFTPHDVFFLRGDRDFGSLPRDSMQQIAPDQDGHQTRSHKFLADVGYVWAFAGSGPSEQLLMNNILMAAFKQPLHLDVMEAAPAQQAAPDVTAYAAPQITGLRAVAHIR